MLPKKLKDELQIALDEEINAVQSVFGGDINEAAKITLSSGQRLFVKWNEAAPKHLFEKEAKGLELLRTAKTELMIPEVVAQNSRFLVLSWIDEGGGNQHSAFQFGRQMALLHKKRNTRFGLTHDNYIGRLPQYNTPHTNWPDFFAMERIDPQVRMGVESGKLSRVLLKEVESLYKNLGSIFPAERPALVHGDLWSGNYMFTKNGGASIYDPAVYFGHREMDVAMSRLFGGFSANFYAGYQQEFPLEAGFDGRVELYNLYPILVHANLFGGSYCSQAENIIKRYA